MTISGITIKELQPGDFDIAKELYLAMGLEIWDDATANRWINETFRADVCKKYTSIIRIDDHPVGICSWQISKTASGLIADYDLEGVYVKPAVRHLGIGAKLLDYRLKQIKQHCNGAFRRLTVYTKYNALYRSRGFVPDSTAWVPGDKLPNLEDFYGKTRFHIAYYYGDRILNGY
jgi:GNAT superfamily N-acetyltransferase